MIELRPHQLSALDAMSASDRGQIIVPTGGGKTICMIEDVKRQFKSPVANTIVVVAPRILLANQLCSEFLEQNLDGNYNVGIDVLHVHSGETHHYSTTKASRISVWSAKNVANNQIIFTTYHSLHRIQESGIHVDAIYFDEAHNAVQKNFIEAVEYYSMYASRCLLYTSPSPRDS